MTGQATPANARHGAWKLTLGSEVDRRIREHLARGRSVAQIAEGVGVAVGYVEALVRDESGADAPPP